MLKKATFIACLSTFVVDISSSPFYSLNVVSVLVWLTCLVSVIGVSPLSHFVASVIVW